jgi:hypothetical protein
MYVLQARVKGKLRLATSAICYQYGEQLTCVYAPQIAATTTYYAKGEWCSFGYLQLEKFFLLRTDLYFYFHNLVWFLPEFGSFMYGIFTFVLYLSSYFPIGRALKCVSRNYHQRDFQHVC